MQRIVLVGTGGHAHVLYDTALLLPDFEVIGWLEHANYEGEPYPLDLPVYRETPETLARLAQDAVGFAYGIGMVRNRPERWEHYQSLKKAGLCPVTLVHPAAWISQRAAIAPGCFIGAGAIVQPFASLGEASIVNTGAIVEHHCQVGRNVHVAPKACLCGEVQVGPHSMIGAQAVVIQGITLGESVMVGAGAVVVKPAAAGQTVIGKPASDLS